ncbi:MAG TPA: DUF4189 domain-containing protein [Chthoniobacterales bacterium]|jgi:hypothetical protein
MKNLTRTVLLGLFALLIALPPALEAASGDRFAAVAYSPKTGRYGYGINYPTKAQAIARAKRECGRGATATNWCKNAWIALAISDSSPGGWGSGWGNTEAEARASARRECLARNPDARVIVCVSATGN